MKIQTMKIQSSNPKISMMLISFLPLFLLAVFVAERLILQTNTDVNWTLIINERWFNGEKPYIDFYEFSPPATFLLFTPAVVIAKIFGLPSDFGLAVEFCACLGVCLILCVRLLKPVIIVTPIQAWLLLSASLVILLIMPAANFGQRDHFATMLALPLLASMTSVLAGHLPKLKDAFLAGFLAGLAICIKPNFALFFTLPAIWLLWKCGWRIVLRRLEFYAVLIPIIIYLISLPLFFYIYLEKILPILVQIYIPAHRDFVDITLNNPLFLWLFIVSTLLFLCQKMLPDFTNQPLCLVLFLASLGGFASYIFQMKGYPYHAIPVISFSVLDCCVFLVCYANFNTRKTIALTFLTSIIAFTSFVFMFEVLLFLPKLPKVKIDLSIYGTHPTIMQIGSEFLGTQLVHALHGRWVGSVQAQWITFNGLLQLHYGHPDAAQKAKIEAILDYDKSLALNDLQTRKPDIIFVGEYNEAVTSPDDPAAQFWQKRWLNDDDFKTVFANYHICQFDHGVTIYCRNML